MPLPMPNPAIHQSSKLSSDLQNRILKRVREGCHVLTAAAAEGVPAEVMDIWLRSKFKGSTRKVFIREIKSAMASARADAEQRVYLRDPLKWLTLGPGRDHCYDSKLVAQYWAEKHNTTNKVHVANQTVLGGTGVDITNPDQTQAFAAKLLSALKDFPEAKAKVLELLNPNHQLIAEEQAPQQQQICAD